MTITKKLDKDTLIVCVDGWIDTLTAPQFHQAAQDLQGAKNVILDFGGVEYISSAGLRETVALFRTVTAQGGSFCVREVAPSVMDVFTMTGFDKKFEIEKKQADDNTTLSLNIQPNRMTDLSPDTEP